MKVFITGGTGFIGSNLVHHILDNRKHDIVGVTGNQTENRLPKEVPVYEPGLFGIEWSKVPDFDVLFHLAANNDTESQNTSEMYWANTASAHELTSQALAHGCHRIVYASSTAVYGVKNSILSEDVEPAPFTPYAWSKLKMERMFAPAPPSLTTVGLRFTNVFGPGEAHKRKRSSMVHQMIESCKARRPFILYEHGEQEREWLYVKDAVGYLIAAATKNSLPYYHNVYVAGTGIPISFNMLARVIAEAFGVEPEIVYIPMPKHLKNVYQTKVHTDIEKIRLELGYTRCWSIHGGVNAMVVDTCV